MKRFGLIFTACLALLGLPAGAISMGPVAVSPPALSWTPSIGEALSPAKDYVWYVQAMDADGEGYKSFSYDKLTAVLVEAVKEQQGQLKTQSALLDEQRTLIARQQEQIQGLVVVLKRLKAM